MIVGLMRAPEKRWSFEKYFTEVDKIVKKKKIFVFNMNAIEMLHVSTDKITNFYLLESIPSKKVLLKYF